MMDMAAWGYSDKEIAAMLPKTSSPCEKPSIYEGDADEEREESMSDKIRYETLYLLPSRAEDGSPERIAWNRETGEYFRVLPCDAKDDVLTGLEWRCSCGNVLRVPKQIYQTELGKARDALVEAVEKYMTCESRDLHCAHAVLVKKYNAYRRAKGGE